MPRSPVARRMERERIHAPATYVAVPVLTWLCRESLLGTTHFRCAVNPFSAQQHISIARSGIPAASLHPTR